MPRRKPELMFHIRFTTPTETFTASSPLTHDRALRVALRGLHPKWGRFAGDESYAELVSVASDEVMETVFMSAAQADYDREAAERIFTSRNGSARPNTVLERVRREIAEGRDPARVVERMLDFLWRQSSAYSYRPYGYHENHHAFRVLSRVQKHAKGWV